MDQTECQAKQWQLSGSGPESYEQFQVPSMFEPLARLFLQHVPLKAGNRVLDVACGTGIVGRLAAHSIAPSGSIFGVDLNPGMVAVAQRSACPAGVTAEWRQGDATDLPCADAAFDAVLCQQGLQFFPDRIAALREMYRVLAPGGMLGLCVWRSIEHSPCNQATVDALTHHVGTETAIKLRAPFALGDVDTLRSLIEEAGFRDIDITEAVVMRRMLPPEESVPGHLASTPVGPQVAALSQETQAALVASISRALLNYRDAKGLAVPQGTHIAVARK